MKLEYCGVHPKCQRVDGVHTPTSAALLKEFPEWPVSNEEIARGIPDSELMPQLETLQAEVRAAVARVDTFAPRADRAESELRASLDRADAIVRAIEKTQRSVGTSQMTADRLAALAKEVTTLATKIDSPRRLAFEEAGGRQEAEQFKALRTRLNKLALALETTAQVQARLRDAEARVDRAYLASGAHGEAIDALRGSLQDLEARTDQNIADLDGQVTASRAELDQVRAATDQERRELRADITRAETIMAKLEHFEDWLKRLADLEKTLAHERSERVENARWVQRRLGRAPEDAEVNERTAE